jgi:hypothetical protein
VRDDRNMNELAAATDFEALIREAMRYLAVVDGFRAEDCGPTWRPELPPRETRRPRRPSRKSGDRRSGNPRA